jgi:hypothetical protein
MSTLLRFPAAGAAALAAGVALAPAAGHAICCPVVPPGQELISSGQLNLVVRDGTTFRLVPNVRISGTADDFALIVPTPGLPALAPVTGDLWNEARNLTRPGVRRRANELDCGTASVAITAVDTQFADATVTVHFQENVGDFEATVISSTTPQSLVNWLTSNGYLPDATLTAAFDPLVADGWYFTAMKLVPGTPVPVDGWDTSVDPVEFTFTAGALDIPLDVLAINVSSVMEMTVYAVDDHRMNLSGFDTLYANRLSAGELAAVRTSYPTLGAYLGEGRVLTRMSRTFQAEELQGTIRLERAATDDETRWIAEGSGVPGDVLLLAGLILGLAWRSARWRVRAAVSAAA